MKQLVVHLDRNSVKFQRVVDNEATDEFHFTFTDKTDFGYKDQLDAFLTKTDFRTMDWDEYSLSWYSEKSTLLPYAIFGTTDLTLAFQLSFGKNTDENDIDFNRIPEHTLVNLYEIPMWVKSFFVTRFPRIVIQHVGTHAIRGAFNGGTFGLKITLLPFHNHFLLMAVKNNDLAFYNIYDFQSKEDVYYHLAHLVQQQNWKSDKGTVVISEPISDYKLFEGLQTDWNKIELFSKLTLQSNPQLMTQYQQFCV
ncbi:MAG: DUF3822 family protein [Bacteroidetes bacterium]|nr:DUF3822 family protein [Bacteroidota bacterium]